MKLSPRASILYDKYDKPWFANRVAELEGDLEVEHAARRIQKGLSDSQAKRQADTIQECHERTAELATTIQDMKNDQA